MWSPDGLDKGGFTLKFLLNGGGYTYPSDGLHMDVDGTLLSAAALPGWRLTSDGLAVALYAGPVVQDYRLTPFDPGSRLHGFYAGAAFATDIWYQPSPATMVALDGSIASIGLIGSARAAIGWRFSELFFVGPETQAIWCVDYQQLQFGAHVTVFVLTHSNGRRPAAGPLNPIAAPAPICASASTRGIERADPRRSAKISRACGGNA